VDAWTAADDAFFLLYARWRHAEALVMRKTAGEASVRAVREAHAAAERLGAALVLAEVEKLARWGRVDLVAGEEDAHPPLPADEYGLTEREREVLASLVDGRTNREIAEAMFISVKTASVHVSNILRKLGVANREEAARLGSRMRGPDPAPGAGNNDAPTLR
jgi:DNA-binding NarL/FixJ family response regulator